MLTKKQFNEFAEKYNLNIKGNSPYKFIDPNDEYLLITFNIEDIKNALGYDNGDNEEDLDGCYCINMDTGNEYYIGNQYVLIEVIERQIIVETFDSLRKAQINMRKRVRECADLSDMEEGYDYEISDMSAWITDGHNHDNYDWLIEAV